jgi:general secretion pathway protein G
MKKVRLGLFLVAFVLYYTHCLFADTLILKTGEQVTGKILSRTNRYVRLQTAVGPVIYFMDVISSVSTDGEQLETPPVVPETAELEKEVAKEKEVTKALAAEPQEETAPPAKGIGKPTFKTVKIIYEITENLPPYERRIQRMVYIDALHNKRRDEETEVFIPGKIQTKRDELNIFDGKRYYHIDLAKGVATYLDYSKEGDFYAWIDNALPAEGEPVGTEEILGKDCRIYETGQIKTWFWNGLILKQRSRNEDAYSSLSAISIEENLPLSDELFKLPSSIKEELVQAAVQSPTQTSSQPPTVTTLPQPTVIPPPKVVVEKKEEAKPPVKEKEADLQLSDKDIERILKADQGQKGDLRDIDFAKIQGDEQSAKKEMAKIDLESISTALELYKIDNGNYPATKQGIASLSGPYLDKELKDPWARAYRYLSPGQQGRSYDLYSAGPDGIDDNADDIR